MCNTLLPSPGGSGHNYCPIQIFKPVWVANTFLDRGMREGINDIDPLKIQKLVYYMQGWNLAVTGSPVIGENFEAWPNGPVVSSLYHLFKNYRWMPISALVPDIDPTTGQNIPLIVNTGMSQFYSVFNAVWERYKNFSGVQLSEMTHAQNTPWSLARASGEQYISNESIKDYFTRLAKA